MAELDVVNRVCRKFNVKSLTEQQISAIDALNRGRDTFLGTKTGSGKSLVYESSPVVLGENGVTTVIAPLNSIMSEQIERLDKLGYRAVQISNDTDREAVTNGYFQFVFGSPEYLVGDDKWRDVLRSNIFTPKHNLIVVDEAHTVIQWGLEHDQEGPFREWFAHIGEMRSLCIGVPLLALTATASPTHRRQIMKNLCFRDHSCVILDSPDRPNIKLNVLKVKNNVDLENVFHWLTTALVEKREYLQRHLIFCNSIKDCASIYMLFFKNMWI
ncbi:ATP-dependent DNA helicase RecQ-like isoform X2 [Crassostrea angulata]|uniref:ATP-dependent DNA helicase RecQ-like isoform X2 n=1 Tax=Magallana angulata TaxID=2784310 RepID=UPI0022B1F622|nr:ATP-dependent DNA helicase RecQ-like isoform X2 [Crassostrea angulata]